MAKNLATNVLAVPNGTVTPTLASINSDPTAGGGFAAPLGSLLMRTDAVFLYIKTGAGNTAWTKIAAGAGQLLTVVYTATGLEGTDFNVSLGVTLPSATYEVYWAPKGVTMIPVLDLPNGGGDRTTMQFRVVTSATLTAGDKLSFLVVQ